MVCECDGTTFEKLNFDQRSIYGINIEKYA